MPVSFRFSRVRRIAGAAILAAALGCGDDSASPNSGTPSDPATETYAASLGVDIATMTRRSDNLYIKDLVVGTGTEATTGRIVRVYYTGYFVNGTQFDSNVGGTTLAFRLGDRQVIDGWEQGLLGMKAGGKRKLVIGSLLGYGASGYQDIPPNATLVFDVELVSVS